jgi:hypothetical protein
VTTHGYFKNEIRKLRDHTAEGLQCLLDITGFMSQVFHEVRDASTPRAATAVFNKSGSSSATDIFDVQLLAAWMNFADGRVALTDLVDTNFNGVPDTTFSNLMAEAEAVRLNPAATRAQILAQKARLESLNVSGISPSRARPPTCVRGRSGAEANGASPSGSQRGCADRRCPRVLGSAMFCAPDLCAVGGLRSPPRWSGIASRDRVSG